MILRKIFYSNPKVTTSKMFFCTSANSSFMICRNYKMLNRHPYTAFCFWYQIIYNHSSSIIKNSNRKTTASSEIKRLSHLPKRCTATRAKLKQIRQPPVWMKLCHNGLMKSVQLPKVKKYSRQLSANELQLMPITELIGVARGVKHVNKETNPVISALWRRLDDMTCEEMIAVADIFFINGVFTPLYTSALISHITEMFELLPLTPFQLQRFALHVANHGNRPPYLQMMFEQHLSQNIDKLHINEILLWCQFFFYGRASVKSSYLLDSIAEKIIKDFENINPYILPVLLKLFRLSGYTKISFYKRLGELIVDTNYFRQYRHLHQVMHIAHGYASVGVTQPELFFYILQECLRKHKTERLKDFAKIIWSCGKLVTDGPEHLGLIYKIIENLEISTNELLSYPDNLVDLLTGLAYLGIYPKKLLDLLFQADVISYILELKKDREKIPQLFFLHNSVKIEYPRYRRGKLSVVDLGNIKKQLSKFRPAVDAQLRKTIYPAVSALIDEFGTECVVCTFFLPHFNTSDILLCYDKELQQFIPPKCVQWQENHSEKQQEDQHHYIVLMLLSKLQTSLDDHMLGQMNAKLRQLSILGHSVITIPAEKASQYLVLDKMMIKVDLMNRINKTLSDLKDY